MKLCATIIDDRIDKQSDIQICIMDTMRKLPAGTSLVVWTNSSFIKEMREWCKYMKYDAYIHPILSEMTIDKYNETLTTPEFWDYYLKWDRVLIFQEDASMLREGIEEFYEWDYVGAPWGWPPYRGNGGLSLRNPKVMQHICKTIKYDPSVHGQEDVYYCNILNGDNRYSQNFTGYPMSLAPVDVCRKFSVESIFNLGSLGCHAIEKYLTKEQCKEIYEQYN